MSQEGSLGSSPSSGAANPGAVESSAADTIAVGLQDLRANNGFTSYAELVVRITRIRQARGVAPAAARPARTTVYDAFRTGRSRVNPELVSDIAFALTGDAEIAAEWKRRCLSIRADLEGVARSGPATGRPPRHPEQALPLDTAATTARARPAWVTVAVLLGCIGVNLTGTAATAWLKAPLYSDMIGTAIAAVAMGPWWGVLVGVSTNLSGVAVNGPSSIPFALVQVAGALVWGYGWRWRRPVTIPSYLGLSLVVGVVCTVVATPILVGLYGGLLRGSADTAALALNELGTPLQLAVFASNLFVSILDKLIAGVIALAVTGTLAARFAPPELVALTASPRVFPENLPS